jgi:hypothetical protein
MPVSYLGSEGFDSATSWAYRLSALTQYLVLKKNSAHNQLCVLINKTKELDGKFDE